MSVVAKVLFPYKGIKANETRQEFYDRWNRVLSINREKKRLKAQWGTYFGRLTNFDDAHNQLEAIILALSNWKSRKEASLVAHISSPALDTIRPMGSPCLQYIEILWRRDDIIDIVAVYRNHDFLNKALGNYIGLGQLLKFIAEQSGKLPGKLVCHSVHAYCDRPSQLKRLVQE